MNLDLTIYTKELLWWLSGKESTCKAGDMGSIPGWRRFLEEGMTTYSSILVWRIPWTEMPGRLQCLGSQRFRHDWSYWACMHYHNGCLILSKNFSQSLVIIFFILHSVNWCITFMDLYMLRHSWISGKNLIWIQCIIFIMCYGIFF